MRLNLATRQFHADVDEPWLNLLRPTVCVADYLAVLVRTYGVVAPFESACKYTPGLGQVVNFKQLTRAGLIAQDLLALGLTPLQVANVPTCPALTMFRGVADALGWLYVIERSALIHDGVRRHLVDRLAIAAACSYLGAFEGHVSDQWNGFGRTLDRFADDAATANEIIRAACEAFETWRQWLRSTKTDTRNVG